MTMHSTNNYSPKSIVQRLFLEHPSVMRIFYSESCGFRGIYTESLDKPYLDNHLFLMYDLDKLDTNWVIREHYFNKNPLFYTSYTLVVKHKTYIVYVFIKPKNISIEPNTLPLEEPLNWMNYIQQKSQGLSVEKS